MNMASKLPRAVVLISGGGTTLKNLVRRKEEGTLQCEFAGVISSNRRSPGLAFANASDIPARAVDWRDAASPMHFSEQIWEQIEEWNAGWIIMGGFLRPLQIIDSFENRVINIHPSLIPSFCGKGFYGLRVHQQVLDFGCKVTGCTVHLVDNEYDHGPIIAQQAVDVRPDDTAESLAARVFAVECQLYPDTLNRVFENGITVVERQVHFGNKRLPSS